MVKWALRTAVLLLLGLVTQQSVWPGVVQAAGSTRVNIKPADGMVYQNDVIRVEVWVEEVVDLYGADIQIQFDPAVFQVVDAKPSQEGVQIKLRSDLLQAGFVIHQEADNLAGKIWYANSQVNPASPASGSGALFEFGLLAISQGAASLEITSQQLSDKNGMPILADASGALYTVQGMRLFLPDVQLGQSQD